MTHRLKILGMLIISGSCFIGFVPANADEGSKDVTLVARAQTFVQEDKVAVVVGISNYDQANTGFRKLDYAAIDAQKLSGTLQGRGYRNPKRLLNNQASKSLILNAIRNAGARIKPGEGTLVFAFSGHGMVSGGENYLATSDSIAIKLRQTGLSVTEVIQAIKRTGVKRAMLFLDACRDDPAPGVKAGGMDGFLNKNYGEGIQILYATAQNEVSWEHRALRRGVFSHFLTKGLQGEAAYDNGLITFNSLATYVEQEVLNWTDGRVSQTQRPFRNSVGETRGDFVLARVGGRPWPLPDPPPRQELVIPTPAPVVARPAPVVTPQPATATRKSFEPDMVNIPAGQFTMGCDLGRDDVARACIDTEKPAHSVMINAFQMGKTEVTFDQWDACTTAGVCFRPNDQGWGRGTRPVINVSWHDIQAYIQWLNQQTGKRYQLPTEAQWEYATRANRDTASPWGNASTCNHANFGGYKCQAGSTKPVALYQANIFGLYDTLGNVWEWTQDCWQGNYNDAPFNGSARSCGQLHDSRVLRGGSWNDDIKYCRSACRSASTPGSRSGAVGFRLALVDGA